MNPWPWLATLGRASIEGGLLILAVWAVCRLWPRLPAWARGSLWWTASARLLVGLLPLANFHMPTPLPVTAVWWPSALASTTNPGGAVTSAAATRPSESVTVASHQVVVEPPPARTRPVVDPRLLPVALLVVWGAGAGLRVFGLMRQGWRVRRVVRRARLLSATQAEMLAPGSAARFAVSSDAPVPMVTGLWKPVILLPDALLRRSARDVDLAVAHELCHLRRGDLWLAWVPALAETLFWFHPLVPRCVREYVQACEEACDQDALCATGANPYDYGRLLLALGVHRRLAGATAMPCGSPNPGQLKRRLSMLRHFSPLSPRLRRAALSVVSAFALVGLAPVRVVPTSASPAPAATASAITAVDAVNAGSTREPAATWQPPADDTPDAPAPRDLEDADDDPTPPAPPAPPAPPRAPRGQIAPIPPLSPIPPIAGFAYSYDDSDDERFAYVLVQGEGHSFTGSGSSADWSEVRRLDRKLDHDFLWVRIGQERYLIEDREVLARVEDAFRPQREIGDRQSRLGDMQSKIGDQQSAIGDEQSRIGDKQSEIGEQQSRLAEQMSRSQTRARRAEIDRLSEDLAERMSDLSREQDQLSLRMEPLSRRQEELGSQMEALSREMARISRQATQKLKSLIDRSIQNGTAKPLH